MSQAPDQVWWTADEIAAAALPDMPATKRGVNRMAERLGWRSQRGLVRRRAGRGGGWEYHWSLFPRRTQSGQHDDNVDLTALSEELVELRARINAIELLIKKKLGAA